MEKDLLHNAWRNVDYQKLFVHNIEINSLKAVVYAFNLTASRYLEYSAAIKFAGKLKPEDLVLEVGCGHSILPTLWQEVGARVVAVDMNRKALKRQLEKSKMISSKYRNKPINPVVASIENLPFRDVYSVVSCISTIEHIPDEGDIRASREIGNVLKNNGLNITSLPLSTFERSITQRDYSVGIPVIFSKFFKSILKTIYYKFRVDRTESYFERYYCAADVDSWQSNPYWYICRIRIFLGSSL
jgi:2-polyprenyl-3-methyl-5-hydroxy-6-metoxy-1,4-benzoquinol methylase